MNDLCMEVKLSGIILNGELFSVKLRFSYHLMVIVSLKNSNHNIVVYELLVDTTYIILISRI